MCNRNFLPHTTRSKSKYRIGISNMVHRHYPKTAQLHTLFCIFWSFWNVYRAVPFCEKQVHRLQKRCQNRIWRDHTWIYVRRMSGVFFFCWIFIASWRKFVSYTIFSNFYCRINWNNFIFD